MLSTMTLMIMNYRCYSGLVNWVGKAFRLVASLKEKFLLSPSKVLMEFERSTSVVEVAMNLHVLSDWDDLKIQTHCVMARCKSLVDMFCEKEESEKEKQLLCKEKIMHQSQMGQVVERIGSQIEQLD